MNLLGLLTSGQRHRASWAPLGRPVACRATRKGEKWSQAGPAGGVLAQGLFSGLKPFLFSKLFLNFQITLISTQIWILNDSYLQNKIQAFHHTKKNMLRHECNN
jgi:hypothetical protein